MEFVMQQMKSTGIEKTGILIFGRIKMKQELELELVKKYPNLFRDYGGDMRLTCMTWGMSHGDGWYDIIDEIGRKLKDLGAEDMIIATQVKEKFGTLRFYYHYDSDKKYPKSFFDRLGRYYYPRNKLMMRIWHNKYSRGIKECLSKIRKLIFGYTFIEKIENIIDEAEERSSITCEYCGENGKIRDNGGWITTLCDRCEEKKWEKPI